MGGRSTRKHFAQGLELILASYELSEPTRGSGVESRHPGKRANQFVNINGLFEAFDRHEAEGLHLEISLHQTEGIGREPDGARRSKLLHPRGQVRCLALGRVVHAQIAADSADHDFTRAEPDSDLHLHAMAVAHRLSIAPYRGLHIESSVAGPHRVILMGEWRAEE